MSRSGTGASAIAANVFGTLGAVCWSVQLIPQIWQNYRNRSTMGLQPSMMLLWATAGIPLGVYNLVRQFPIALQIQPQILTLLSLVTWIQCFYYPDSDRRYFANVKRGAPRCVFLLLATSACFGAVEAGLVLLLRHYTPVSSGRPDMYWPPTVSMGALAGMLLCLGVSRHWLDIYREHTVRGISFLFCGIDALGDVTSLISVLLWWKAGIEELDILGLIVYASEFVMWSGVFLAGVWYNMGLGPWIMNYLGKKVIPATQQDVPVRRDDRISGTGSTVDHPTCAEQSYGTGTAFRTASRSSVELAQVNHTHESRPRTVLPR